MLAIECLCGFDNNRITWAYFKLKVVLNLVIPLKKLRWRDSPQGFGSLTTSMKFSTHWSLSTNQVAFSVTHQSRRYTCWWCLDYALVSVGLQLFQTRASIVCFVEHGASVQWHRRFIYQELQRTVNIRHLYFDSRCRKLLRSCDNLVILCQVWQVCLPFAVYTRWLHSNLVRTVRCDLDGCVLVENMWLSALPSWFCM